VVKVVIEALGFLAGFLCLMETRVKTLAKVLDQHRVGVADAGASRIRAFQMLVVETSA
jgi:hypothetical protein